MAGQNPIAHCLERLFLADDTVLAEKAEHFQGLCSTRVPSKVFGKGPNSKPVISIHLAYENLGRHDWDSKLAAELAGCKPAVYDTAVSLTRKHLGIVPVVSFESLTVALGCTTMIKQVESLWDSFQESYLGNLSVAKKLSAKEELSQPVWKGAIVYACAKALGVNSYISHCGTITIT
ncbi:hypothetical protein J3Q64DRAFT_1646348 [Phycomyces blakesleeanus]|uniref:ORC6 second cyclin-like domain-containing protein n=1 Tax=Phycomyces blakesleeanus TaxID=4837 RepID=A0ABR3ANR0_PHYBL